MQRARYPIGCIGSYMYMVYSYENGALLINYIKNEVLLDFFTRTVYMYRMV